MGTWGTGIFDNDIASDARGVWDDAFARGPEAAKSAVTAELADALEDEEDGPLIWIALAELQLTQASLDDEVRRAALAAIDVDSEHWQHEASPADATERRRVLEELRARIEAAR
jgi:hypothetical protein